MIFSVDKKSFLLLSMVSALALSCGQKNSGQINETKWIKANIIGSDDRVKVPNTNVYPYSSIGKVVALGTGTGVLIAPDLVLTAAHVAQNFSYRFIPGAQGKEEKWGQFRVGKIIFPKVFQEAKCLEEETEENKWICNNYDFAFLQLKEKVVGVRPLKLREFQNKEQMKLRINAVGYGAPTSNNQKQQKNPCYAYLMYWMKGTSYIYFNIPRSYDEKDFVMMMPNNCDAMSGDSGSPLITYEQENGEHFVVGIQVRAMNNKKTPDWDTFGDPFRDEWFDKTGEGASTAIPAQLILQELKNNEEIKALNISL